MFETNRLLIRKFNQTDIDAVFAMRKDEEVMRFIRQPQTNRQEAENWLDLLSSRWQTERIGFCALIEKNSNCLIGWCGLWRLKETNEVEVGYAIVKEYWGKGYAVEAAEVFLKYGFEDLSFEKIVAVANPENRNSWRVMEKLGMTFDHIGKYYDNDLVHYTIKKDDYFRNRKTLD